MLPCVLVTTKYTTTPMMARPTMTPTAMPIVVADVLDELEGAEVAPGALVGAGVGVVLGVVEGALPWL